MSCPKTPHILKEYFDGDQSVVQRGEIDRHCQNCDTCRLERDRMLAAQDRLRHWEAQEVPHWDRGLAVFEREHRLEPRSGVRSFWWNWVPTGASLLMLTVLVLNVSVTSGQNGVNIAFGAAASDKPVEAMEQQLAVYTDLLTERQEARLQEYLVSIEDRQDRRNVQLLQAIIDQTSQQNAENFEQIFTYFDQRRQQDLRDVQLSYQQLANSDYETIRTMRQLANFVQFQGEPR